MLRTITPPPPPSPASQPQGGTGGESSNRTLMLVLSYLWILCLIPLFVEKDDQEVSWHARNGTVLLIAEVIAWVAVTIIGMIPFIGLIGCLLSVVLWIGVLVLRIMGIVKATKGERFLIPVVSDYVDKIKV